MRFFLGVHKYAPILGLHGEMGWVSLSVQRRVSMARFWNRLINMENTRLAKIIFLCDYQLHTNNWSSHMNIIFEQSNNLKIFYNLRKCCIISIYERLVNNFACYWHDQIQYKPKLRPYITFKMT